MHRSTTTTSAGWSLLTYFSNIDCNNFRRLDNIDCSDITSKHNIDE
jgi:hypothetical protein